MIPASDWIVVGLLRASLGLSVAALAVAACVMLLRVRSPRAEQWAWLFVLTQGVIVLPLTVRIPTHWIEGDRVPSAVRMPQPSAGATPEPARTPTIGLDGSNRRPVADMEIQTVSEVGPSVAAPPIPARSPLGWYDAALIVWITGLSALVGIGLVRYLVFVGKVRHADPAPPDWEAEWLRILEEDSIRTRIPLFIADDEGPALCRLPEGYRLVVPEGLWGSLGPIERAAILRHERTHFIRGDLGMALLARVLAAVQWFNPLSWWAVSRYESQAEFVCDRISAGEDPASFAETLIHLGSGGRRSRIAGVSPAGAGNLFERVRRLLADDVRPARWRGVILIGLAVLALGMSSVRFQLRAAAMRSEIAEEKAADPRSNLPPRALVRLGTDDLRTRSFLTDLAFSPDGKTIAAAEANTQAPRISLFNVKTGRRIRVINPHVKPGGWVKCLAYSPDGTKILWGEIGGIVGLWDLAHDRLLFREKIHAHAVNEVAFSPDGSLIASVGEDGLASLRRTDDPRRVARQIATGEREGPGRAGLLVPAPAADPPPVGPLCLAFTPDGSRLVVGSGSSGSIWVWRIADGRLLRRIEKATGGNLRQAVNPVLNSVSVTPDGRRIMSVGQRTLPRVETKIKYGPLNVTMTEVYFWDIETGERAQTICDGDEYGFGRAALSRDGRRIVIGDFGSLRILDAETGKTEHSIESPGWWGDNPVFSPDGATVAVPIQNSIGLFDVRTGRRLQHGEKTPVGMVASAAWSPSGDWIVTGNEDGEVRVWDATNGKLVWHKVLAPAIPPGGSNARPASVLFSLDGRRVVAAGRRDDPETYKGGIVAIFEASRGLRIREGFPEEVRHAALSPDREIVVVATSNGGWGDTRLYGIDVETMRQLYVSPHEDRNRAALTQMRSIQFQPDSTSLLAATGDCNVIRFDSKSGRELGRFFADWRTPEQIKARKPREPQMWEGAFSDDGRTLATSAEDAVCIWDTETGKQRLRIHHPHRKGCQVALTADGKTLATSDVNYVGDEGEDTIRLYDTSTGEQIMTLEPGDNRADVLAFSPDGSKLFTGFHRGSGMIWDVRRAHH